MLELVIQLSAECLRVGKNVILHNQQPACGGNCRDLISLALSYLELIFNPECSYHQRCRDRATNTGTYVLVSLKFDCLLVLTTSNGTEKEILF